MSGAALRQVAELKRAATSRCVKPAAERSAVQRPGALKYGRRLKAVLYLLALESPTKQAFQAW